MENEAILDKSNYEKFLDFVNQPFMLVIIACLLLGLILFILYRGGSYGKKKYITLNGRMDVLEQREVEYEQGLNKKFEEKDKELKREYTNFANKSIEFFNGHKEELNAICKSLSHINNVKVQKELENINNGKREETKDN